MLRCCSRSARSRRNDAAWCGRRRCLLPPQLVCGHLPDVALERLCRLWGMAGYRAAPGCNRVQVLVCLPFGRAPRYPSELRYRYARSGAVGWLSQPCRALHRVRAGPRQAPWVASCYFRRKIGAGRCGHVLSQARRLYGGRRHRLFRVRIQPRAATHALDATGSRLSAEGQGYGLAGPHGLTGAPLTRLLTVIIPPTSCF